MEAQQKPCHRGVGVTSPRLPPSPSPPPRHPPCTSNLLLPRQRPATKTAPDTTKNKTADRCRYCHAECSLLPSSSPPSPRVEEEEEIRQPPTTLTKRKQTGWKKTLCLNRSHVSASRMTKRVKRRALNAYFGPLPPPSPGRLHWKPDERS